MRNNPYPGATRYFDRHKKIRWRFRLKGYKPCTLHGDYGSKEFETSYTMATKGGIRETPTKAAYGSFDWLIADYIRSEDYLRIGKTFSYNLGKQLERFRLVHGERFVADLQREHIEFIIGEKRHTPAAANELLKLFRRLIKFAIRKRLVVIDVSASIKKFETNPLGYHTWTDDEIATFERCYKNNFKALLALRLMLYTGASRQDVITMGWQSVRAGRIAYTRIKTGGIVDLPILPQLIEYLEGVPPGQFLFLAHGENQKPYKPETFGNWFNGLCKDAGLIKCSAHGLRKAGATRLANAGGTEFEIMAYLGHKTTDEAKTYTKAANRILLADSGMEKMNNLANPVTRLAIWKRK